MILYIGAEMLSHIQASMFLYVQAEMLLIYTGLNDFVYRCKNAFIYSGIFPGWIFFPSRCHFFLLWWLIMTNFGMSALLSIGCTGQSCLLDREKVSFGPVTSGFLPENHLWIGVMNFKVFTPFLLFCFFFSMLQILSKLSWSFIWHLIIHRKTLFPFIYCSIRW